MGSRLFHAAAGDLEVVGCNMDVLPDDILIMVFSMMPGKSLVHGCRLVCQRWKTLLDEPVVWRMKCEMEDVRIPNIADYSLDLMRLYFHRCFENNLLKNWNASEGLKNWRIEGNGGNRFRVETCAQVSDSPAGSQPLEFLKEIGCNACWATSYDWCSKSQTVDLIKAGIPEDLLDVWQPRIFVSEWTAARNDCASVYVMNVDLLNENGKLVKSFKKEHIVAQWEGGGWTQITHSFQNYGPGVRSVQFRHAGKDRQFWAGHYGAKMAAPCVMVTFENLS